MSSEQDVLFEIDEAIRRIENGTYGICEMTDEPINIERLEALPYVRHSIKAQSELEKGHRRFDHLAVLCMEFNICLLKD